MIKIKAGKLVWEYAAIYGVVDKHGNPDTAAVVSWMEEYVNHPENFQNPEPTEPERLESIKGYIKAMINCSTTGRMKCSKTNDARSVE